MTLLPALLAFSLILVGLFFFVRRLKPAATDAAEPGVSPTIHRIRANVRAILRGGHPTAEVSSFGATEIDQRPFTVTILVGTDRERDAIRENGKLRDRFRQALVDADYPAPGIARVQFEIESRQTIERDRESGGR